MPQECVMLFAELNPTVMFLTGTIGAAIGVFVFLFKRGKGSNPGR